MKKGRKYDSLSEAPYGVYLIKYCIATSKEEVVMRLRGPSGKNSGYTYLIVETGCYWPDEDNEQALKQTCWEALPDD